MKRFLVAGLIFFVLIAAFGCTKEKSAVPSKLGNLDLASYIQGEEAKASINKLHQTSTIPVKDAYVAQYYSGSLKATLWLSIAYSESDNQRLLELMTTEINKGNNPFTKPKEKVMDSLTVYELSGLGQRHYYYAAGDKLAWLGVDPAIAEVALRDLIKEIKP